MKSDSISLAQLKVGAIINTSSGGGDLESEDKILHILKGAGIIEVKTWCGGSDQMDRSFAEATAESLDVLIVLGGDGTIRTAAEACCEIRPYVIPLPGGTMNILPRALYGDVSWEQALENTLAGPVAKILSGGQVANKRFFVAAIVGTPALWTQARESLREGDIVNALENGTVVFQRMFETKVRYVFSEDSRGEAEAVALICPLVSKEMSDSEQALEAAAIDVENASEVVGLATAAAFGKWRDDKNVILTKTKRLTVQSNNEMPAMLDGESVSLGTSVEINFVSKALTALVPVK
jgi:diacylglycerol kinase family enzyme